MDKKAKADQNADLASTAAVNYERDIPHLASLQQTGVQQTGGRPADPHLTALVWKGGVRWGVVIEKPFSLKHYKFTAIIANVVLMCGVQILEYFVKY